MTTQITKASLEENIRQWELARNVDKEIVYNELLGCLNRATKRGERNIWVGWDRHIALDTDTEYFKERLTLEGLSYDIKILGNTKCHVISLPTTNESPDVASNK